MARHHSLYAERAVGTGSQTCPDVYDDGVLRIGRTSVPAGLAIAGEIDESTYPGLVETLGKMLGTLGELVDGPGEIHVSLAGLTYCDLTGLRAILSLAGNGRDGPGDSAKRLVLHEVPSHLRAVMQIMGWDTTPGLFYDGPDDF